jgi:hypothetical protein
VRRRIFTVCGLVLAGFAHGQTPPTVPAPVPKPPGLLPPSVTGKPHDPVTPVAAVTPRVAPADRFKTPGYPVETQAAVQSCREAADWCTRMSQPDGRFMGGVDPSLARPLAGTDLAQACAALALARAAKFTGDEKTAATASQACLTLLTLTKPDATDPAMRVPTIAAEKGNKVGFAAVLATAIYELPTPDAKLVAEADKLCKFLYTRLRSDGSVHYTEGETSPTKADPDGVNTYPGLCLQAVMASDRVATEAWKRDALARGVKFYHEVFKATPTPELCGTLLPAVCDYALRVKSKEANEFAFEMADWLCDRQYTASDARNLRWVGAFKPTGGDEPTARMCGGVEGLCAAVTLTTQVPDGTRYARYRKAAREGLAFARSLQFGAANGAHFTPEFRAKYLDGGACGSPTDGMLRCEHTAGLLNCQLRYLESGGEKE